MHSSWQRLGRLYGGAATHLIFQTIIWLLNSHYSSSKRPAPLQKRRHSTPPGRSNRYIIAYAAAMRSVYWIEVL
jgi:hypothetical protein